MKIAIITGSCGLIGCEAVEFFTRKGFKVVGIDNDLRSYFFGEKASTGWVKRYLQRKIKDYQHSTADIRDFNKLQRIFQKYRSDIKLIIHAAAQPSHDWAAREPVTDFTINANGTLNLLELTRQYAPRAVFIFTSTNKVYGDLPNQLPLIEKATRLDLPKGHPFYQGIDERMSIDQSTHSLFGVSKLSADILVQEYGKYFGMKTVCFRAGCLTGPKHSGAQLHGFLSFLMKCCLRGEPYTVFGYKGKQVRDNIHSYDLVHAFYHFYQKPKRGAVYNMGGGRKNSCSLLEAIELCEKITGKNLKWKYSPQERKGDHRWYISNTKKFQKDYPSWRIKFGLESMLAEIFNQWKRD